MDPLRELLGVDHRQTLEFFALIFRDVSDPSVDKQELLYHASVLAHYAQVPTTTDDDLGTPADLTAVFDHFVLDRSSQRDSVTMELAGTQCLLLAGFFEEQMCQRHNIRWYTELGAGFFDRAAIQALSVPKARLLHRTAQGFETWRQRYACVSRELRDRPYVLATPRPPTLLS
jgi:hypothetical protein